jgi:hypothetical protein
VPFFDESDTTAKSLLISKQKALICMLASVASANTVPGDGYITSEDVTH